MSVQLPPAVAGALVHAPGRRATWFELFFDLAFVAAVAQLSGPFASEYGLAGAARYVFALLVLWWAWLGHTFHGSRFDEDRRDQRAIGLVQVFAVIFIGYGAGDAFGARAWAFAGGIGAFKALLALAYLRERHRPYARGLCHAYLAVYACQAVGWWLSTAASGSMQLALWVAMLALDAVTPLLVARHTHGVPPHPEHLPERFGLFTIILLGESVAAAIHGLDHAGTLQPAALTVVSGAAVLAFCYWTAYFDRARGVAERHVAHAHAGRRLRMWAYGHIPLYLGVGGVAAGTVALASHPDAHGAQPWLFAGAAALAMIGVTLIGASHGDGEDAPLTASWPHFVLALATAALPVTAGTYLVVPSCAAAAVAQLVVATRRRSATRVS